LVDQTLLSFRVSLSLFYLVHQPLELLIKVLPATRHSFAPFVAQLK
jgi:hypothetical protein